MRLLTRFALVTTAVATGLAGSTIAVASSHSVTINFDEQTFAEDWVPVTDQYDGVVDITGAFGIVKGVSQGDPGSWGLEGTDGPQFLGLNNPGTITFVFAEPVLSFTIDCSRSNGSQVSTTLVVTALDEESNQLDQQSEVVGDVNTWTAFAVSSLTPFTTVTVSNDGGDNPFGCDRLVVMPAEEPVTSTEAPATTDAPSTTTGPTTTADSPTTTEATTTPTSTDALPTTTMTPVLPPTGSGDATLLVLAGLVLATGLALFSLRRQSPLDV